MEIHSHTPVQNDDEICCSTCGEVLDQTVENIDDHSPSNIGGEYSAFGLNTMMVGLSLERSMNWHHQKNQNLVNYQRVLDRFIDICHKHYIPDKIAYETMRRLLKKRRGLYSYRLQIREFIDVMKEDYRYFIKVKEIQQAYEMVTGT